MLSSSHPASSKASAKIGMGPKSRLSYIDRASSTMVDVSHRGSVVVLQPANPDDRVIEAGPSDDFAVLGVVCGVFRPFYEQEPPPSIDESTAS